MFSDEEMRAFNHSGLLPKPDESEEAFLKRIGVLKQYKTDSFPEGMQDAFSLCEKLFDALPDWVAIIEQQKGLSAWQGAVLWIQEDSQGNHVPLIQLSPRLKTSWLSRWYKNDEVIAHEIVHAMRLPLNASRFEEIVAYQTSRSSFRKMWGPIFRHPYEVYILLIAILFGWVGMFWSAAFFLVGMPWVVCVWGGMRLLWTQRIFKRAKARLSPLLKDKDKALAVLARLTDDEIAFFAKASKKEIEEFVQKAKKEQLRWQMLFFVYFFDFSYS